MIRDSEKILKYLKDNGYEVSFFTEEKAFKPPVYHAAILKGKQVIQKNDSLVSSGEALKDAYQIWKLNGENPSGSDLKV